MNVVYKLLLVFMLSQSFVAYAMKSDAIDLPKDQHNRQFSKRLESIQKNTDKILKKNNILGQFAEEKKFKRNESVQISSMCERIRLILTLYKQSDTGNLIYYNNFANRVLYDIVGFSRDFLQYKQEGKITRSHCKKHTSEIGKLMILVHNIEDCSHQVNDIFNLDEEFMSHRVEFTSLFGEGFLKIKTS